MEKQKIIDFERIRSAIEYIAVNYKEQPSLDDVAKHLNMSPFHFQRMFTEWAGISPKQFLQYISITHAKKLLEESVSVFETAHEIGFSGTSRLHDLFINIEGMTPGEYKNGGKALSINYAFAETLFGKILIAATPKGICFLSFADDETGSLGILKKLFSNAEYNNRVDEHIQNVMRFFITDCKDFNGIRLHIKGTPFQIKIWETLLKIPRGNLVTYANIATTVDNSKAYRAVGTAIGQNPIAYLIPCHRVIQTGGILGQYHWGEARKAAIIGWEEAQKIEADEEN